MIIFRAKCRGRAYVIMEIKEDTIVANQAKKTSEILWHRRLGHVHLAALHKIPNLGITQNTKNDSEDRQTGKCETCMRSKMRKGVFPKNHVRKTTAVLQLIHSDVEGPISPVSKGGS